MGKNYRNNAWFQSTHTTAAGIALEQRASTFDAASIGYMPPVYRLRGFAVSGSTAVAISTTPIKVIYGRSSIDAITQEITNEPGAGIVGVTGLIGIEGEYIALETTVAHADGGLTFIMFGD